MPASSGLKATLYKAQYPIAHSFLMKSLLLSLVVVLTAVCSNASPANAPIIDKRGGYGVGSQIGYGLEKFGMGLANGFNNLFNDHTYRGFNPSGTSGGSGGPYSVGPYGNFPAYSNIGAGLYKRHRATGPLPVERVPGDNYFFLGGNSGYGIGPGYGKFPFHILN